MICVINDKIVIPITMIFKGVIQTNHIDFDFQDIATFKCLDEEDPITKVVIDNFKKNANIIHDQYGASRKLNRLLNNPSLIKPLVYNGLTKMNIPTQYKIQFVNNDNKYLIDDHCCYVTYGIPYLQLNISFKED